MAIAPMTNMELNLLNNSITSIFEALKKQMYQKCPEKSLKL